MLEHKNKSGNVTNNHFAPFVTPEKYAELTGFTVEAVKNQVQRGKLPVLKRSSVNDSRRTLINMRALELFALEQAEQHQDWKAAM
ncbi:hypothetical protein OH458_20695 [Vibrio sp. MarTm2]|uniref:hypothetical protein n=1 Tax=Vibrio sp. MarTm2 TaxID=2998831 RepID=UPI0022CD317D|nr:hypothetical protein [Vibrio sp. MarTm2]MDA0130485.1 hypothetical protein [Vibrio sp. MarTm2]